MSRIGCMAVFAATESVVASSGELTVYVGTYGERVAIQIDQGRSRLAIADFASREDVKTLLRGLLSALNVADEGGLEADPNDDTGDRLQRISETMIAVDDL